MPPSFDVIYSPVQIIGLPSNVTVMARRIGAIDRVHALLWWIRDELGITVDPVTMFNDPSYDLNRFGEHKLACNCQVRVRFEMHPLGRIDRFRMGEAAVPTAEIECEPCETHAGPGDDPRKNRDWNGTLAAWNHDPRRPDAFKRKD